MPKWIRDSGGRLVKCDTPQRREFEVILNIMEATPEYQHSHQGCQDNLNEFRSMRDHMHPPRMSAPSSKENEKFYECWERYMEAINACPHHGFDTWLLQKSRGSYGFLSYVTDVSRGWDEPTKGEVGKMKSQLNAYNAKAGMYTLKEDDDMKAKLAAMTRRLEELELKRIHEVQAVAEAPVQVKLCPNCQSYEHLVEECPAISAEREMYRDQANVVGQFRPNNNAPYGNTYNSSWRNHPNFSWKARATQYQQPDPSSQQSSSIEQAIANLTKMDGMQNDMNQKFDNIQYSISRLTNLNTLQEKGRFPSQSHQNPKPTPKPHVEKEEEIKKGKEMEDKESEINEEKKDSDATRKVIPEKELLKEEMLKKSLLHLFLKHYMRKRGLEMQLKSLKY
ncbi:hypothetical protein CK203_058084 [Vitis vinifera]|uniref:Retrotransposon gag domain-containing protein n=1 Tax=Vitis vinifera TaxID=29760 RepID=A0A438GGS2_VITVI|nr:hypothetical protein CK203_058084 [Vitis vinifera]